MANQEHLEILKQGVEIWNRWRMDNPDVNPDLNNIHFENFSFQKYDLTKSDLTYCKFSNCSFGNADFFLSDFSNSIMTGEYLCAKSFGGAIFRNAEIINSNLEDIDIAEADFTGAKLQGSCFVCSRLWETKFSHANLTNCDFHSADLENADFSSANLQGCNFQDVNLKHACLIDANLINCNLKEADLRWAYLTNANLTGAKLYGTARFNWKIDNVKCDYIYFDDNARIRIPLNRNFAPKEFEKCYRSVPTVEIAFEKNINNADHFILELIVHQAKERYPDLNLELLSLDKKGFYPTAVFGIAKDEQREKVYKYIVAQQQEHIKTLKSQVQNLEMDNISKNQMLAELIKGISSANTITNIFQPCARQINQLGENAQYVEYMEIYTVTLENIKQAIQETPQRSLGKRSKKKILEWLEQAPKTLVGEAAKNGVKKLYELLISQDLIRIIPKIAPYLDDLSRIVENMTRF